MFPLAQAASAPRDPGIYLIFNTVSGKCYPGQAKDIRERLGEHYRDLISGKHGNRHLAASWRKHSASAFVFYVLELVSGGSGLKQRLVAREQFWMDQWPEALRYNIAPAAGSNLGVKFSPESRARIRTLKLNQSPETRAKIAAANRRRAPEVYDGVRLALRGKKHSAERSAKMSALRRGKKGRPHSAEARARMSAAQRGRTFSAEHRAKISASRKGSRATAETRAKLSASHIGIKPSDETRRKLSIAQCRRWAIRATEREMAKSREE